ncbi:hypothetical protein ACODT3_42520 [Streptomyces sp. 4.24]|uniref:hypothetical protein n=1 Tax=Streptomyces tritrimontium TaxID=3406573 RepID=UPI003BB55C99
MKATVTTNEDCVQEGLRALAHYESGRAALGRTPERDEDVELALAASAHIGDQQQDTHITVASLRTDRDEAVTVFSDLISNLFHAADGIVPPRMLIDTVLAEETMTPADVAYTWARLTPEARRYAVFLAAVGHAAAASHDLYVQDLLEEGRAVFEDEVEEERYKRLNARRAGA